MADVESGDILRLGAGMTLDGAYDIVNVFHILAEMDTGLTWAVITTLLAGYLDDLYDNIKTQLSDTIDSLAISVMNVTQVTTLGTIAWPAPWVGSDAGDPTAPGVCCFTWGRTYKPRVQIRKYLGVFGEANVAAGVWTATVRNACIALMDEHIARTDMGSNRFFTGVAYNRALLTYETAVSSDASAEPAYQRRRKRGRGS